MSKNSSKTILLVENDPKNIQAIASVLMPEGYNLSFAMNGDDALDQIKSAAFDLIMIDSQIPKSSAFDVVVQMQLIPLNCDTPVIFLLESVSREMIENIFDAGVVDYIVKPFIEQEMLTRVKTHVGRQLLSDSAPSRIESKVSEKMDKNFDKKMDRLLEKNQKVTHSQEEIILTLCSLIEKRSDEKEAHVRRVADVSYLLALLIGFNDEEATVLKMAAPMHDIGNLAIPDKILSKPDKLSMEEFEKVEQHTRYGYEMLKNSNDPILKVASMLCLQHHEKYNGSGYPEGLKSDNIHIFSRIVALADVFDTLSDDRVYGKAWSDTDIERYIQGEKGQHFDPTLVDLFFKYKDRFFALRSKAKLF